MIYIDQNPNPSGAYPNPKNQPFPGCIALTDEQAAMFFKYNGFVVVVQYGDNVIVEPNTETWEVWKASLPTESTKSTPTAQDDTDAMLVDHEYRLTLLELGITE